ncbi:MAG: 23S rRNA (guanosine(2251)-2'-O)-methyltransferase RlmB [Bacilli bacterium]|nr:23S rRNA (guanosine(2251)-2'-O)-methyltransferase RlmB [Bacilli bacterium]
MDVFGRNVAKDLLKNPEKIKKIILQDNFSDKDIISLIEKSNLRVEYRSKREMDDLSGGVHQGIILTIPDYQYKDLNSIINSNNDDVIVILDHLEDPHNFGAIIRTCEAAGIHSIIIPKDRQVQVNSTVMKTSAGTLDSMNIVSVSNIVNSLEQLKKAGYWIVGTALENSVDYREVDYSGKIAIIIGNEGSGISQLVSRNCDFLVKIPMYGTTNSLNASVAAGIMIYEVIRNRK